MNLLEHQVGEFVLRSGNICRVAFRTYKGYQRFDVRIYYQAEDGTWQPTTKGINISVAQLLELRRLVTDAERLAVEAGQIDPSDYE